MIAPKRHEFYTSRWISIITTDKVSKVSAASGPNSSRAIRPGDVQPGDVTKAAGLPPEVMSELNAWRRFSVAQKLSWTARRSATRMEDQAYALLGLFEINMPLLCGERRDAMARLQREIIKGSADESNFACSDSGKQESLERLYLVSACPGDHE